MGLADPTVPLSALLDRSDIRRGGTLAQVASASVPTGFAALDAELPGEGWPTGCLTELLPAHEGIGELRVLGPALAALSCAGKRLAWIGPPHLPYAPALDAAGIALAQLLIVRTAAARDTLWAAEQALASAACGAVLVWPGTVKYPELRRLQLAAEKARALAVLFRPSRAASDASPAALRLALHTAAGALAVRILKRRGAVCAHPVIVDLDPLRSGAPFPRVPRAVDRAPPSRPPARSAYPQPCDA
ncbi:MAG TPA: translesion DNA synthesis-associated protein ImuA [Burkholderiales bacterium]|nr:translesion DNA synthesis-associated protein ImuA [Burkholderiales bacterium]